LLFIDTGVLLVVSQFGVCSCQLCVRTNKSNNNGLLEAD
jgi:hypothetical protein